MATDSTSPFSINVIILSGRSGSGKSSTAYEMCHVLRLSKSMHVHIDGDNLNTFYPRDGNPDLAMQNLEAIWKQYWITACHQWARRNELEVRNRKFIVIISGTGMVLHASRITEILREGVSSTGTETQIDMDHLTMSFHLVLLELQSDIVHQRLKSREIGGELEDHLKSTDQIAEVLSALKMETDMVVVDSSVRNVHEIALEILEKCSIASE